MTFRPLALALLCLLALPGARAQSPSACGSLANAYGPFDYRTERYGKLHVVEAYHLTPEVESLLKGHTGTIEQDLDYTLRASPNHHRALAALSRLALRSNGVLPKMPRSVDCYFDRAMRFQPTDHMPPLLYAGYLTQLGRTEPAIKLIKQVVAMPEVWGLTHFNAGLMFFDLKAYDLALEQAHLAMAKGMERPDLRDRLKAVGQWRDPEPVADAASAPASAASAP